MATNCVRRVTLTGATRLPRRTFVPTYRRFANSQGLRYASDTGAATARGAAAPEATTTTAAAEAAKEAPKKSGRGLRRTVLGTSLALTLLVGWVYGSDTRASIHRYGAVPLIRTFFPDAEDAHHIGVDALRILYKYGLHPRERGDPDGDGALETEVGGIILTFIAQKNAYGQNRSLGTSCQTLSVSQAGLTSMPKSPTRCSRSVPLSWKLEAPPLCHRTATHALEYSDCLRRKL